MKDWYNRSCSKQTAKYTCPKCNLRYCSLECYKNEVGDEDNVCSIYSSSILNNFSFAILYSQSHLQCTESFYKDNILQEISNQRVSNEEKKKILELLKRVGREDVSADSDDEEAGNLLKTSLQLFPSVNILMAYRFMILETSVNDLVERFRSLDIGENPFFIVK